MFPNTDDRERTPPEWCILLMGTTSKAEWDAIVARITRASDGLPDWWYSRVEARAMYTRQRATWQPAGQESAPPGDGQEG